MATIKASYRASSNLTVTNLHSIASSSTFLAGWESAAVDNTTNLDLDILVSGKIVVGNSATAGQIRVYIVGMLDDSTWPDVFDGTESTETVTDSEIRDAFCRLGALIEVDADGGTDDTYFFGPFSVAELFGSSIVPAKFVIFITHNSGVNLASSGNQVTIKGVGATVA